MLAFLRGGDDDEVEFCYNRAPGFRAALSDQTGTAGGYTVPQALALTIEVGLASSCVRRLAEVLVTEDGAPYPWPTINPGSGSVGTGEIVAENSVGSLADPAFGALVLNAHRFHSKKVAVPNELFEDGGERGLAGLVLALVRRVARYQNTVFTTGTGSGQPYGVVSGATVEVTTGSITYANLVSLFDSLDEVWFEDPANPPKWMMAKATYGAILNILDLQDRPIFIGPRYMMGCEVVLNPAMPSTSSGNAPILFGDFSQYKVRDVGDVRFKRAMEVATYMDSDQSLTWCSLRSDGGLLVADSARPPVVALKMS
jgi:HK97 family phage major capsid protein